MKNISIIFVQGFYSLLRTSNFLLLICGIAHVGNADKVCYLYR